MNHIANKYNIDLQNNKFDPEAILIEIEKYFAENLDRFSKFKNPTAPKYSIV